MTYTTQTVATTDGPFSWLADTDGAVVSSGWTDDVAALLSRLPRAAQGSPVRPADHPVIADAVAAYYAGDLGAPDRVPVALAGTPLQLEGWAALRAIAPGAPLTYAALADALGRPTAVRAAASVCARNRAALFVPCHRVIGSDGSLTGFAWGVAVKRALLARERAAIA